MEQGVARAAQADASARGAEAEALQAKLDSVVAAVPAVEAVVVKLVVKLAEAQGSCRDAAGGFAEVGAAPRAMFASTGTTIALLQ